MPGASMLLRWLCLEMPTAIVEMVNVLHNIILVSDCQGSKLPQTQWLETTQVYYLVVLGVRSPKSVSLG